MPRRVGTLVPLLLLCGIFGLAQEAEFYGNYGDMRLLPPQTLQHNDFTFVRLMYNGRIPHYIKNWYTDYPTGDQNLVCILRRTSGIDVAQETRVISVHHPDLLSIR